MSYYVIEGKPSHLSDLRKNLRAKDRLEMTCLGLSEKFAMRKTFQASIMRKTAIVDGEVGAMWGCGGPLMGGIGEPWLLTADVVERVPIGFVKEGRKAVGDMLEIFPKLENYVADSYQEACKFLFVLGFTLGEPFALGPNKSLFRKFSLER